MLTQFLPQNPVTMLFFIPLLFIFAIAFLAWFLVACRRLPRAWASINQVFSDPSTSRRQVLFPSTITIAGLPLLIGTTPFVNMDSYQANIGGATGQFQGTFALSVTAKSSLSPSTSLAIKPGDKIYYDGGTLDSTTNVTSGGTLDVNSSTGVLFGICDPTGPGLASGTTAVINVLVSQSA